jgi:hypothetical protein
MPPARAACSTGASKSGCSSTKVFLLRLAYKKGVTLSRPWWTKMWARTQPAPTFFSEMSVILRNLRENTTSKTSCATVYQQQLTGTRVAVITERDRFKNRKSSCLSNSHTYNRQLRTGYAQFRLPLMNQQFLRLCKTSFCDTRFATRCGRSGQVAAGVPGVSATV